jgi:hypothetical protein
MVSHPVIPTTGEAFVDVRFGAAEIIESLFLHFG